MGDLLGSPRVAPPFCFSRQFGPPLLGRRSPPSPVIIISLPGQPLRRGPLYRTRGGRRSSSRCLNDGHGAHWAKNRVLASRMAQSDRAGRSKPACLFAASISPSRAFRRYIIMANRAGGSKVRASTSQAGPLEPPFRKAQIVSSAVILRVRSYQR